jgi:hypothetical protein
MITQVSKEVFKDTKGVSYSRLSKLAESPQAYQAALADEPKSSAIALGAAVDILLTEPDIFDEQIYVMLAKRPESDMMLKFCEHYAETDDRNEAHLVSGYKINIQRVQDKFDVEGKNYYDALLAGKDKKVLDIEDMFKANQIVRLLKENPYTKKYFVAEDGVDLVFQPHILWNLAFHSLLTKEEGQLKTVQAKSVLDVVRIDHKNKTVEPIELKTGEDSFMRSFWKYKRYLQASMYEDAVYKAIWDKEEIAEQYIIENIKFIYADSKLYYPPKIYRMTDGDLSAGRSGHIDTKTSRVTKGYIQLAAELEWHEKMDLWEYSYDVYQTDGKIDINAFQF